MRITKQDLEKLCNRLNTELGRPTQYKIGNDIQIGYFHIDTSCGPGNRLAETTNVHGACNMHGPRGTKGAVYEYLSGVLDGVRLWKEKSPK